MKNDDKLITLDQAKFLKSIGFREPTEYGVYVDPTTGTIDERHISDFKDLKIFNDRSYFYSLITVKEYRSYLLKLRLDMLKEINDTFK